MANYDLVEKFLMRTPTSEGEKISKSDYFAINDILRAAYYSVIVRDSYFYDKNAPHKKVHVPKTVTCNIQFLESKEARRMCSSVIESLERSLKNYDQDLAIIKNLWAFAEFSLKNGQSFVFENLPKEGKMVNWEALTMKLLDRNFNFGQSELLQQFYDKAKELNVKYHNAEPDVTTEDRQA